jgi:cell shape-determining protein MreC
MAEISGTIKILEGRVITKKNGLEEVWSRGGGDPNNYILVKGLTYRLLNGKNQESSPKQIEEIEEEDDIEEDDDYNPF